MCITDRHTQLHTRRRVHDSGRVIHSNNVVVLQESAGELYLEVGEDVKDHSDFGSQVT